jgi:hypothetical protein
MLIYKPGATEPEIKIFRTAPTLDDLKDGIGGGFLELVPGFHSIEHDGELHRCMAFVDEEGKLDYRTSGVKKNGPDQTNNFASVLWDKALRRKGHPGLIGPDGRAVDWLVGQIAVVYGDDEFMGSL